MSRLATWRRGPGDPDTVRGWLFRLSADPVSGEPPPKLDPKRRWAIAAGLAAYLSAAGALIVCVPRFGGSLAIMLHIPFQVWSMVRASRRKAVPPPVLEPGEGFDVRMTVGTHSGTTGMDRGWLIFSEGWILFEGARTSFALTRGEARLLPTQSMTLKLEDRRTVQFALPGERPNYDSLTRAFRQWNAEPIPDGQAILPPVEIHPTIWVGRVTLSVLGAVIMAVPTVLAVLYAYWVVVGLGGIVLVACLGLAAFYDQRTKEAMHAVHPYQSTFEAFSGRSALAAPSHLPEGP